MHRSKLKRAVNFEKLFHRVKSNISQHIFSANWLIVDLGGKAHKESSSRKHNQKAPEDMSDWKCENTCYCTSILG